MKQYALSKRALLAGTAALITTSSGLFAGDIAPMLAPPPSDCDGCIKPGFYAEAALLYMNTYTSEANDYDGDWDFGYRGGIGYETASGLFFELNGFYYKGDWDADDGFQSGDIKHYYVDALIGDTVHCGEACLRIAAGLRWGGIDIDADGNRNIGNIATRKGGFLGSDASYEFDGWGPVIEIEGTRALNDRFGLYAELRQSILFGEGEYKSRGYNDTSDTLASITEIGLGLEATFALGGVDAFIRGGIEGQYWLVDSSDHGLFGGVVKIGGRF